MNTLLFVEPDATNAPHLPRFIGLPDAPSIEMRQALLNQAHQILRGIRAELQAVAKSDNEACRRAHLFELCRIIQTLTGQAESIGFSAIVQMSYAVEALGKELHGNVSKLNPFSLRTLAQGLDCLDGLVGCAGHDANEALTAPTILVLDDDAITRRLIGASLERTGLRCLRLDDPNVALRVLHENSFHLIFLDVRMPGLDGFELCKKIRASESNKTTPVVFITGLSDLSNRALSILSGGNDFIGKPFLSSELAVKALFHVLAPLTQQGQSNHSGKLTSRPRLDSVSAMRV